MDRSQANDPFPTDNLLGCCWDIRVSNDAAAKLRTRLLLYFGKNFLGLIFGCEIVENVLQI